MTWRWPFANPWIVAPLKPSDRAAAFGRWSVRRLNFEHACILDIAAKLRLAVAQHHAADANCA
jgi:hypothetical protein